MQVTITNKGSKNLTAQIFGGGDNGVKINSINPFNIKSIIVTMKIRSKEEKQIADYKDKIVDIVFESVALDDKIDELRLKKNNFAVEQEYEKASAIRGKETKLCNKKSELNFDLHVLCKEIQTIETKIADGEIKKLKRLKLIKKKININTKIIDIDMSVRLLNYLNMIGVKDIRSILKLSHSQLSNTSSFGKKSLTELVEILAKYDLKLKN